MRVAVFRCVTDGYDLPVVKNDVVDGFDYFFFTDSEKVELPGYDTVKVSEEAAKNFSGPLINRYYKILCHRVLQDYDYSIYLDGNVVVHSGLRELFLKFRYSEAQIGLFKHNKNHTLEEEIESVITFNKADQEHVLRERSIIIENKVDLSTTISDNSILFRRHSGIELAMDAWFDQTARFSRRDQLSLPVVLSRFDLDVFWFDFAQRNFNLYFSVSTHMGVKATFRHKVKVSLFSFVRAFCLQFLRLLDQR